MNNGTGERLTADETRGTALYTRLRGRLGLCTREEAVSRSAPPGRTLLERDLARLGEAARRERAFGLAGSWLYDPNRLVALRQAEALARHLLESHLQALGQTREGQTREGQTRKSRRDGIATASNDRRSRSDRSALEDPQA